MTTTADAPPSAPDTLGARLQQALALHQQGRFADAKARYEAILREDPAQPDALHLLGVLSLQGGDAATAVRLMGEAITACPGNPEFHLNQAIALRALGQLDAALACHERVLALDADHLNAHLGRAALLKSLGRTGEAVAGYERALALRPNLPEAHYNLGNLHLQAGRADAAAASYERALALKPDLIQARINLGNALLQLGQAEAALTCAGAAVAQCPELAEAHVVHGDALMATLQPETAIACYDRALALRPDLAQALTNRGKAQFHLGRDEVALASFEAALALQPGSSETWLLRGNVLGKLHRHEAALAAYERAIELLPGYAEAWFNKGHCLIRLKRAEEGVACLEQAHRLRPDHPLLEGELLNARLGICDWTDFDASRARMATALAEDQIAMLPFSVQCLIDAPALQLRAARRYAAMIQQAVPEKAPVFPPRVPGGKIRLGYFSADFRDHPVTHLITALLEHHDRNDFEVIGFAFGPPATGAVRERLERAVDRMVDIDGLTDAQAAQLARDLGIDIAVDLGGYTQDSRSGIFAHRAAPVQVSYIGFIGTMGAPWIDYLIADATLIPAEQQPHYAEKIVCLPWYQANDRESHASARVFSRAELGLPERGVVLASFNNHFKITPDVFTRWMHILARVPDSVLYLLVGPAVARRNLRAAAAAQGIAPERIVFAERLPRADYLARYRVADLFLDTWPCNAGATASDAIAMGVPVLTCAGQAMMSRLAASVVTALGMPELVTNTPDDYEERAVALATQPALLTALHEKVEHQRLVAPLYDTPRFTRHLEAAFRAMHARRLAGQAPAPLVIAP